MFHMLFHKKFNAIYTSKVSYVVLTAVSRRQGKNQGQRIFLPRRTRPDRVFE
jgi:hypothetical protein